MANVSEGQLAAIGAVLRAGDDGSLRNAQKSLADAFQCRACDGVGKFWNCPPIVRGETPGVPVVRVCAVCGGTGSTSSVDPYTGQLCTR